MILNPKRGVGEEVVTTSNEFNSRDFEMLTLNDFVVVKSGPEVRIFCLKTTRLISKLFEGDQVLTIWTQKDQDKDVELICALTKTGHILECSNFESVERKPLPKFLHMSSKTFYARVETSNNGTASSFVAVEKCDVNDCKIIAKSILKNNVQCFGSVNTYQGKLMFDFNEHFLVKSEYVVVGSDSDTKLVFFSRTTTHRPWIKNILRNRSVSAVACHPHGELLAITADTSGRIQIWRQNNDFKFFFSEIHWHSLPVRCLNFSPDGVNFYSGGCEGVVLKWELNSGKRLAVVPRMGFAICHIHSSDEAVIVATENNALKIFTPNLEDDKMITGLTKETQNSVIFWHPQTSCLVMMGSRKRIQFFDPIVATQKLGLEASNYNDVLGDLDVDKMSVSVMSCMSVSTCGTWLATVEKNWDTMNGNCLKIWKFTNLTGTAQFECNTRVNGVHDDEVINMTFVQLPKTLGLLTCSQEGKAKLWELGQQELWQPVRTFSFMRAIPRCGDCSKDQSVLAIGFDTKITLWSSDILSLIATLSAKDLQEDESSNYTSMAFANGHLLVAANASGIHVWSLLTNQLTHRMALGQPKLVKTVHSIMVTCESGILRFDDGLKLSYVSREKSDRCVLTCNTSQCYVLRRILGGENNELRRITLGGESDVKAEQTKSSETFDRLSSQDGLSLMTSQMAKVKVDHKTDYHTPKVGPVLTSNMISNPVSKNSLSILKQSLPD